MEIIANIVAIILFGSISAFCFSSAILFQSRRTILCSEDELNINGSVKFFTGRPDYYYATLFILNLFASVGIVVSSIIILNQTTAFGTIAILSFLLFILSGVYKSARLISSKSGVIWITKHSMKAVRFFYYLFYPFVKSFSSISFRWLVESETDLLSEEKIKNLIEEGSLNGSMNEEQSDFLTRVIEIRNQRIYEAITPRTEIVGIEINSTVDEALGLFIESGYSKLIVYEENLDNIKGFILLKDFFNRPENLRSVIREIDFIPDSKRSLEMLNHFLKKQSTIAVVVDEFGGTAGIITVEDLIEELFGEIRDEYDEEEKLVRRLGPNSFLINGSVEIDYLNEEYELELPTGDYETVGGFISYKLGRIPFKGESFKIDRFTILILRSDKRKIDLLKLTVEPDFN